jgi:acyl-CoA reductase-like NAD-dependent aldehyde dehydrogenase
MAVTDAGDTGGSRPLMFEDRDPRTDRLIGLVPTMNADDVALAVHEARDAFESWSGLSFTQRAEHLLRVRDLLLDRVRELIGVITSETGKLGTEAVVTEIMGACEAIGYYAKHGEKALRPRKLSAGSMLHKKAEQRYEPLGVVGVISPWNYPFVLSMTPIVTALFAGNTVVHKPSEVTPLVGRFIGALFSEVGGHPDVVKVVTGGGEVGDALVRSGVQKVCFTGSVATGKSVMAAAAESLTPVLLELGGKDPMIVCADADLDRAANGAVWGAFQNSGQACMSVERVYVAEAVYDEFVEKVVDKTARVRQGVGTGHDIGSMTFPPQIATVERHVDDAVRRGAAVLAGGSRRSGREGLWYEPTVLVDVDHSMAIMREETFGPVLPIMKVADESEALELANETNFGLGSSVWTRDRSTAARLVEGLEAGNVCVNDCLINYGMHDLPYGGVKDSGLGRVHGAEGLREFCAVKSVVTDRGGLTREPWWYPLPGPLGKLTTRLLRIQYRRGLGQKFRLPG